MKKPPIPGISSDSGFTLIELVIVIVILGVLASVGIPVIGGMIGASKENATKEEIILLKTAIVGRMDTGVRGYENDVGSAPSTLQDLCVKPAGVPDWDRFTKIGWNGPYVENDGGSYLKDAWGADYVYDSVSRTIISVGGPDTISVAF